MTGSAEENNKRHWHGWVVGAGNVWWWAVENLSLRKVDSKCEKHCWVISTDGSCKEVEQGISRIHSSFCCKVRVAIDKLIQT